jgi:hypothetical protein
MLLALTTLGGIAHASPPSPEADVIMVSASSSHRGVADDYLVLPEGGELTGQMRFVTAEPSLGGKALSFSDLALFGLSTRWSLGRHVELSGGVELLPKQPSYTSESTWQGAGAGLKVMIGTRSAIALGADLGPLLDHDGRFYRASASVEHRVPIHDFLTFDLRGGADTVSVLDPSRRAMVAEAAGEARALFHSDRGEWGGWVGLGYAVPFAHSGEDPTTQMSVDPRPRLDFHIGSVLALVQEWDLFVDYAVIDRGDLSNPATRLPILDGGFDQRQIVFGVTRHVGGRSNGGS